MHEVNCNEKVQRIQMLMLTAKGLAKGLKGAPKNFPQKVLICLNFDPAKDVVWGCFSLEQTRIKNIFCQIFLGCHFIKSKP